MTKRQGLVRDIAKLFIKYNLADWQFVIDALKQGGAEYDEIATAIESLGAKNKKSKSPLPKRRVRDRSADQFLATVDPDRRNFLQKVQEDLRTSKSLRLADIRNEYLKMGGKEDLPVKKDDAIRVFISHLANVSDTALVSTVAELLKQNTNLQDDYKKWFEIIYGPTKGATGKLL